MEPENVGQAFRNDQKLQEFVLEDVTPTDRILGAGSFGSVVEVTYKQLACAGKKLHETLIDVGNEGVAEVVCKYLRECQLMSSLHHPNFVQFIGLCFLPGNQLPLLVMELLETSLDNLLEHMANLPLSLKRSILEDVACGLFYLHDRQPPVIHRDLTSNNVLMTASLVAKITDMGNSRIVNMRPGQIAKTLTKYPGTLVYMPPEALDNVHRYGPSIDVFSFGHLALYTIIQKFPGELFPSTYVINREVRGRSEIERRKEYIDILEARINPLHPTLVELVKQCLQNEASERPSTAELLANLQGLREVMEGEYGDARKLMKLDIEKLRLAKELKEKKRSIEALKEILTSKDSEIEELKGKVENSRELKAKIDVLTKQLESVTLKSSKDLEEASAELNKKTKLIENLQAELKNRNLAKTVDTVQIVMCGLMVSCGERSERKSRCISRGLGRQMFPQYLHKKHMRIQRERLNRYWRVKPASKLDQVIDGMHEPGVDKHLFKIASTLVDLEMLTPELDLRTQCLKDFEKEYSTSNRVRCELLSKWKRKQGTKATYSKLLKACVETSNSDAAKAIVTLLNEQREIKDSHAAEQPHHAGIEAKKVPEKARQVNIETPQLKTATENQLRQAETEPYQQEFEKHEEWPYDELWGGNKENVKNYLRKTWKENVGYPSQTVKGEAHQILRVWLCPALEVPKHVCLQYKNWLPFSQNRRGDSHKLIRTGFTFNGTVSYLH